MEGGLYVAEQIDLFDILPDQSRLNGFYYERHSQMFVSFVHGRRHFEIHVNECKGPDWPKEWREKIKRERAI